MEDADRADRPTGQSAHPLDIEPPPSGRVRRAHRRVQMADAGPTGRLRLDAVARMFQDVSDEDTTDAGFPSDDPWVVRKVEMAVSRFPALRDELVLTTWCSGIGPRWAERRIRVEITPTPGAGPGTELAIDAAVLWVHLDHAGRPARLPAGFDDLFAEAARGRRVAARLGHDPAPPGLVGSPFPLRVTDIDVMGHVNNAVSWQPVEVELARRNDLVTPLSVSVEHPAPLEATGRPEVLARHGVGDEGFDLWIVDGGRLRTSARVRPGRPLR